MLAEEAPAVLPRELLCGVIFNEFSEMDPCTDTKCRERYCDDTPYSDSGALCLSHSQIFSSADVPYTEQIGKDRHPDDQDSDGGGYFPGGAAAAAAAAVFRHPFAHVEGAVRESNHHDGHYSDDSNENNSNPQPYHHKLCCCVDDTTDDDERYYTTDDDDDIDDQNK